MKIIKIFLALNLGFVSSFGARIEKVKAFPQFKIVDVAAAPKGPTFAMALEDKTIRIMNAQNSQVSKVLKGHTAPICCIKFSHNGKYLVSGDDAAHIFLWDLASGQKLRALNAGHTKGIQSVSFSKDDKLVVSTGRDDVMIVTNVTNGKSVKKISSNGCNFTKGVCGNGKVATSTLSGGTQLLCMIKNYQLLHSFDGHAKTGVNDVELNEACTKAFTGGRDGCAILWDLAKKSVLHKCRGHQDWVIHTALNKVGNLGATSSTDRSVIVWNLNNGTKIAQLQNQSYIGSPIAFTADDHYLITANESDYLQINRVIK